MTAPETPAPPISADVDLRGLDYMPLFGVHLLNSDFNAVCTDAEWRVGVTLWLASWNQVPAASLPNDNVTLTRLADLGRDVSTFKKLKNNALRGFELCSDGRLYHRFLAEKALVVWTERVKLRQRKQRWKDARKSSPETFMERSKNVSGDVPGTSPGTYPGTSQELIRDVLGTPVERIEVEVEVEVEVKDKEKDKTNTSSARVFTPTSDGSDQRKAARACGDEFVTELINLGVKVSVSDARLLRWLKIATQEQIRQACAIARSRKVGPIPAGYLDPIVEEIVNGKSKNHARSGNSADVFARSSEAAFD